MARIEPARSPDDRGARPLISSATVPWPIENTWKPPESVITGRSQRMKRCSPPWRAISSCPGVRNRWNVLPSTMSKPSSAASRTSSVLTTALVASGTNAGVRTSPWARRSVPVRARVPASRVRMAKLGIGGRQATAPRRTHGAEPTGGERPERPPVGHPWRLRGVRLDRLLLVPDADGHLARLALLGLGDADLEHAAVERGRYGVGVDALGQRQRAGERPERA